jgi:Phosphotransferase enzyme family
MTGRLASGPTARHASRTSGRGAASDRRLVGLLEGALAEVLGGEPSITVLGRRPAEGTTSYESEILSLSIGADPPITVFLKDFGRRRLPKNHPDGGARREIAVYRQLLLEAGLGTPAYYGAVWSARHRWLLLEFVEDARELRSADRGAWVDAAVWLGRLQGRFVDRVQLLEAAAFLPRHDAAFFHRQARSALDAVGQIDSALTSRLGGVLAGYERLVDVMASQPITLVHGSFRPQNILVVDGRRSRRICAVDWEHAALGSVLYDLAFLSQGSHGAELAGLLEAWREEAEAHRVLLPDRARHGYILDCFRLAKVVRSLGDAVALRFPRAAVERYVVLGEELRSSLG